MINAGLYIHIPFCYSKCAYCDFYSFPADETLKEEYINALINQLRLWGTELKDKKFDTVYIGGGTPTALNSDLLHRLLNAVNVNLNITEDAEISMEANPDSAEYELLKCALSSGVNRLSFGAQSFCDSELTLLNRRHKAQDIYKAVCKARECGFSNISLDIMFALPGQTDLSLDYTLSKLNELKPNHISAYGLKLEPGTELYEKKKDLILPDEDTEYGFYIKICDFLKNDGYRHYEISNFALDGFESRHNLKYWRCGEYLGLGPAAHSYINGMRFSYDRDINNYIKSSKSSIAAPDCTEKIDKNTEILEYIMLSLRTSDGIDINNLKKYLDIQYVLKIIVEAKRLEENSYCRYTEDNIYLTDKGFWVSNTIITRFLELAGL